MQPGGAGVRGCVGDLLGQFTRPIQIMHHQPAVFPRCFDGNISHAEHPLPEGLQHANVLYFGKLNDPHGFGSDSSFVAQFVSRDGQLDTLPIEMPLDGPEQNEQAGDGKVGVALVGILKCQIFVVNDNRRAYYEQGAHVPRLDELQTGTNYDVGHQAQL